MHTDDVGNHGTYKTYYKNIAMIWLQLKLTGGSLSEIYVINQTLYTHKAIEIKCWLRFTGLNTLQDTNFIPKFWVKFLYILFERVLVVRESLGVIWIGFGIHFLFDFFLNLFI